MTLNEIYGLPAIDSCSDQIQETYRGDLHLYLRHFLFSKFRWLKIHYTSDLFHRHDICLTFHDTYRVL